VDWSASSSTIFASSLLIFPSFVTFADLRLKAGVPGTLLVLARALMINNVSQATSEDLSAGLQAALSSLPEDAIKEVEVGVSEAAGRTENEKKLHLIKEQEELIKEEKVPNSPFLPLSPPLPPFRPLTLKLFPTLPCSKRKRTPKRPCLLSSACSWPRRRLPRFRETRLPKEIS